MFQPKKPYSAVTVTIETLTSEAYDEEDVGGIPDLVEVITIQASGPTEAARAIRKKLKYGNVHRQIRALVLLDGLIQNAGPRFQRTFADEPLLERLRVCGTSELSDPEVRKKCRELFGSWSQYANKPGLERIARLHRELPKRKVAVTQERSKVLKETENPFGDEEGDEPASPTAAGPSSPSQSRSSRSRGSSMVDSFKHQQAPSLPASGSGSGSGSGSDKKKRNSKSRGKRRPFNLEAEKEQMKSVIAESSLAATNLLNVLQTINREKERISDNNLAVERFESCKLLRRKVLRFIHHVDHEQWLGPLLHANDELVHALMTFEQLDQSVDADSDSDDELAEQAHLYRMAAIKGKEVLAAKEGTTTTSPTRAEHPDIAGLSINSSPKQTPPPRPSSKPAFSAPPVPPPLHSNPRPTAQSRQDPYQSEEEDDDDPFADRNAM
ncbi:lsb5-possible role in the regulation of actin cytoskeletal organization [Trichoderma cornu-damae]|uniref:Lsb5-possible role in the regulation of actin cytoskeletal organization n=1 Tax=Trichoderma cornu-damae TaxID=654480 RepID=A0A9P8TVW3_9HYPO|nr:lsb5-possible role in the regulation of actin cytoskeletal organization [Trichoderma cornu-damae]